MAFKLVSKNEIFRYLDDDPTEVQWGIPRHSNYESMRYHPAHGLWTPLYYIQLDGRMEDFTTFVNAFNISLGNAGYDFLTDKFLHIEKQGHSQTDKIFLRGWDDHEWLSSQLTAWADSDPPVIKNNMVRLSDRYLYVDYQHPGGLVRVWSCPLDRSTDWAIEFTGTEAVSNYSSTFTISLAAEAGHLWLCDIKGHAYLYDADNKTMASHYKHLFYSGAYNTFDNFRVGFVQELGVFVGWWADSGAGTNTDDFICVWAPEVEPANLSDPVALGTVEKWNVVTFEVTLTGDQGEPIEDYPVDWAITAGTGDLTGTQSMTDSDGKATIGYIPASDSTSLTLQATVTY